MATFVSVFTGFVVDLADGPLAAGAPVVFVGPWLVVDGPCFVVDGPWLVVDGACFVDGPWFPELPR